MVVIEDQFCPTDHTHLRQIMTYAALRDRKFVDSLLERDGFEPSVPVRRNLKRLFPDLYRATPVLVAAAAPRN